MSNPKLPACGNSHCSVSTGIHDGLTFGYGKLDHNGYWQHPCRPCAKAFDERNPGSEYGPAWPFEGSKVEMNSNQESPTSEELRSLGLTDDEIADYQDCEMYDGLLETFIERVPSPDAIQLKVKALLAAKKAK